MKRRSLLTLLAAGVSGCTSSGISADRTTPDGAEEPPPFPAADDVIYPASNGGRIVMTATPYEAELPDSTIEFRVTNTHPNLFETNFHYWRLHKFVDGEWWYLGVFEPLDSLDHLLPLASQTWEITIDNDTLGTRNEQLSQSASSSFTLAGLGTGTYAFSIVGEFEGYGTSLAVVAPFRLGGETVDLVPGPNIETTRDGDTIRVTETRTSRDPEYRLEATRPASTGEVPRLVPEWGLRQAGIRNTVPFLGDGIQKAVFSRTKPTVFARNRVDEATFAYEGSAVEFTLSSV